jgi:hypothetical protein
MRIYDFHGDALIDFVLTREMLGDVGCLLTGRGYRGTIQVLPNMMHPHFKNHLAFAIDRSGRDIPADAVIVLGVNIRPRTCPVLGFLVDKDTEGIYYGHLLTEAAPEETRLILWHLMESVDTFPEAYAEWFKKLYDVHYDNTKQP